MDFVIKRLTEDEFRKFASLVYDESGIFLKDTKLTLLSNRLRKRLQALQFGEFSEYYDYLQNLPYQGRLKEYEQMIDVVTTNETYFFRNERQFESLKDFCLPEIARKKKEKTLRIWSAACSTGEEPYTIAVCVLERMALFSGWKIEILATDIAPSVLEFAKIGKYMGRRIEKVPLEYLKKYFIQIENEQGAFQVKDDLKRIVSFYYLNFFKNPYPKDIDIIFCRNVMIYFDKEHQKTLIANFYKSILDEGYLFIGHSETLHMISEDFTYSKIMESPVYIPTPRR
ncbi:MAG: protein-glutamate O-methyltransferase CheR [Spirochaetes bacterium]|nr:protein-glutamate O-methyltransferase CheR [Spirochaetota bacterium]